VPEQEKKESFWTTLPGMLTGLAALVTAVTGLWLAIPHGSTPKPDAAAAITAGTSASEPPAKPILPAGGSSAQPSAAVTTAPSIPAASVVVTPRSGAPTTLKIDTFVHNYYDKSIELMNGQSIALEKIKTIDFLDVHSDQRMVDVKLTLNDGRVVTGDLYKDYAFKGESDLGPFTIFMTDIKQIAFNR